MSPWQSCQEETVALWTQKSPCVLWSTLSWSERYSFQNEKMLPWFVLFSPIFFAKYTTYIFENYQIQKWTILWFGVIVLKLYYKAIKTFLNAFKVVFSLLFFINPPHYHGCRARYAPFKKRSTEVFMCGNRTHFSIPFLWIQ